MARRPGFLTIPGRFCIVVFVYFCGFFAALECKMEKKELIGEFKKIFGEGTNEIVTVFSPGRVNLIGEHTDYNGGHVFPAALTIGTYFAARKRTDRLVRFFSGNFPKNGIVTRSLDALAYDETKGFSNYLMGMIWAYGEKERFVVEQGLDVYLWGNIPNSSGLSSSASVEVGMGAVLNALFGFDVPNLEIALAGQFAENRYNGVNCGIMDQFAIAMGKRDHAMFLNTATLDYEYVPIALRGKKIVIICTNKKRGLADSKYNERRAECEEALRRIQKVKNVSSLGELTNEEFEEVKDAIGDPVLERRARHAVSENRRTVDAVKLLNEGDLSAFGALMNASHVSLRDDYEVTGKELDAIAESAWETEGVIGARMTGAGFGGCAVAIVEDEAVGRFIEKVGAAYLEKIGYEASFYVVEIGDGTHRF